MPVKNPELPTEKVVRYKLEVKNDTHEVVLNSSLKVFAPVKSIGWQETVSVTADAPFELESDDYGNQVLLFDIAELTPYSTRFITVTAKIKFNKNHKSPNLTSIKDRFLIGERHIEKNNLKISMLATTLTKTASGDTLLNVAEETHSWILKNMTYIGYQKKDLGAGYAIRHMRGDCTEYMYLNAAIMRSQGIPNIPVAGFYLSGTNGVLSTASYHNWNYFWSGDNWVISDSQGDAFNKNQKKYVVFRVIAKGEVQTLSNTHRFSVSDKRLNVKLI